MNILNANKVSNLVSGPVRSIGVQSRSITGTMPDGNRYESALERDFMSLLQFDPLIDIYTPQPLTLKYTDTDGNLRRFTPDGLIEWRTDLPVFDPRPILVEIKYREAFQGDWSNWRQRLRAARNYATERGWLFDVYTERDIRTPYLENIKFLLPYLRRASVPDLELQVLEKLLEFLESTPRELLDSISDDKWAQAALIPVIWKLLAQRDIGCNLLRPLTMISPIYSLRG
nr:heteromeric transposase endonuclease subunit TnsA [uncultured Undibacterium sp.]